MKYDGMKGGKEGGRKERRRKLWYEVMVTGRMKEKKGGRKKGKEVGCIAGKIRSQGVSKKGVSIIIKMNTY